VKVLGSPPKCFQLLQTKLPLVLLPAIFEFEKFSVMGEKKMFTKAKEAFQSRGVSLIAVFLEGSEGT